MYTSTERYADAPNYKWSGTQTANLYHDKKNMPRRLKRVNNSKRSLKIKLILVLLICKTKVIIQNIRLAISWCVCSKNFVVSILIVTVSDLTEYVFYVPEVYMYIYIYIYMDGQTDKETDRKTDASDHKVLFFSQYHSNNIYTVRYRRMIIHGKGVIVNHLYLVTSIFNWHFKMVCISTDLHGTVHVKKWKQCVRFWFLLYKEITVAFWSKLKWKEHDCTRANNFKS